MRWRMDRPMAEPSDYQITEAMLKYGGSFVAGLGTLYRQADDVNRAKLKAAFENYWEEYRRFCLHGTEQP